MSEPTDRIVTITPDALRALLDVRARDSEPDSLGLRIAVTGEQGGGYVHDMSFELVDEAAPDDVVVREGELPVIVPAESVQKLRGAVIELAGGQAWSVANPNRPKRQLPLIPVGGPEGGHEGHAHGGGGHAGHAHEAAPSSPAVDLEIPPELRASLEGDLGRKIGMLLEHQINPAIAMHGGRADLVGVRDETVYLRLSGGCQGCSMASVTLRQGIETAIREAVPEITDIVDVTDHASGSNPFFTATGR